jgi:hypothetical protein
VYLPPVLEDLELTLQQLLDETSMESLQTEQTEQAEQAPFVMDPSEQASRERQGRSGLTPQEGRRRKHFKTSEALAWPVPWNGQPWEQVLDERGLPERRAPQSYSSAIMAYLTGMSYRIMREDGVAPTEPTTLRHIRSSAPQVESVAERVWGRARRDGRAYISDEQPSHRGSYRVGSVTWAVASGYVSWSWLERQCDAAGRFAWKNYEADWMSKRSAAGHNGGKKSKRPAVFTWAHVEPYQHLTYGQQAIRVGCHVNTIKKIHRNRKAETGTR